MSKIKFLEPDENGNVRLPDHLDRLFNKLGMQMRFHTISGKNEFLTLIHMCQIAEDFFKNERSSAYNFIDDLNESDYSPLVLKSLRYAIKCHADTNHFYDDKPYLVHLAMTYEVGVAFSHLLLPEEKDDVLSSCWCHDVIEDTRQTYNDVKKNTNENIANIVFALTNEKGKNRKERANDKYYAGIRATTGATFVKTCDRLANVAYSKDNKSGMFALYQEENPAFIKELYDFKYEEMFSKLNQFLA